MLVSEAWASQAPKVAGSYVSPHRPSAGNDMAVKGHTNDTLL